MGAMVRHSAGMLARENWDVIREQASVLLKSGLLPQSIKTPEQAIAIAVTAQELGIGMMQGFREIHIINGKPGLSATLQLALAYQRVPGFRVRWLRANAEEAMAEFSRAGHDPFVSRFTMDEAKTAGICGKSVWRQYPKAMLRARVISQGVRVMAPEAVLGMGYTPEELGADVIDADAVVVSETVSEPERLNEPTASAEPAVVEAESDNPTLPEGTSTAPQSPPVASDPPAGTPPSDLDAIDKARKATHAHARKLLGMDHDELKEFLDTETTSAFSVDDWRGAYKRLTEDFNAQAQDMYPGNTSLTQKEMECVRDLAQTRRRANRGESLMAEMDESVQAIEAENDPPKLCQQILRLALVPFDTGAAGERTLFPSEAELSNYFAREFGVRHWRKCGNKTQMDMLERLNIMADNWRRRGTR